MTPFWNMVRALSHFGLVVFGVWCVLNVLVVAFLVFVARVSVGELGLMAVVLFNAIAVLCSRLYWPSFMRPKPPRDDD